MQLYLKSLKIENFRGFIKPSKINFAIPNGTSGSGLTLIVGPNNSGKTTIIDSVRRFYKNEVQFSEEEIPKSKKVKIIIENSESEQKIIHTEGSSSANIVGKNFFPKVENMVFLQSRRYFYHYVGGSSNSYEQYKNHNLNMEKDQNDSIFINRMMEIDKDKDKKKLFTNVIKRLVKNFNNWNIGFSRGHNFFKYVSNKDQYHSSEFLGDGLISLFKIVAILVENRKDEILIIDEPELSLHPDSQEEFANLIYKYSKNKQIIISTHSTYFLNFFEIKNGTHIIRTNKIKDKCIVSIIDAKKITSLLKDWHKPYLLDNLMKEIFFTEKNILFVEGMEDAALLRKYIKDNEMKANFSIAGYGIGGASNYSLFLDLAKQLNLKAALLLDSDEQTRKIYDNAKKGFPFFEKGILCHSKDDIRDKSYKCLICKNKDKIKDGLFSEKGEIKSKENKAEIDKILSDLNEYFSD